MDNKELLRRIETSHKWQSDAILNLRELIKNENRFTQTATDELRQDILQNVQLNISEMEIMALELEAE